MQQASLYPFKRTVVNDAVFGVRAHLRRDHRFGTERYTNAADDHVLSHHGALDGSGERLARAWHGSTVDVDRNDDCDDCDSGTD